MAVMKLLTLMAISQAALVGYLLYSPSLLDIEPLEFTPPVAPKLKGPLAPNELLTKMQKLFNGRIKGPESFAVHNGWMYTGVEGGHVVRFDSDQAFTNIVQFGKKCAGPWEKKVCGRPLGIRAANDKLYVVDAYYGLQEIDIATGKSTELVSGKQKVGGETLQFLDHLDIHKSTGKIYMTQFSTKWCLGQTMHSYMEYDTTGRVLSYDMKSGKVEVVLDKLHAANGIQITTDQSALLITETFKWRVLRYELTGPKKGQVSVFAELPGEVDNIVATGRGGYWVAILNTHDPDSPSPADRMASYPSVRKVIARAIHAVGSVIDWVADLSPSFGLKGLATEVKNGEFIGDHVIDRCMLIEMDEEGNFLRSLQSSDKRFCQISEVLELKGYLYLGSFKNNFLGKLKL